MLIAFSGPVKSRPSWIKVNGLKEFNRAVQRDKSGESRMILDPEIKKWTVKRVET